MKSPTSKMNQKICLIIPKKNKLSLQYFSDIFNQSKSQLTY